MPDGEICQGDVFSIGPAGLGSVEHHHIVASDHGADSVVVLLPISSWEDWKDESCIITRQDYPPLRHDSCIDYGYGRIVAIEALRRKLGSGQIRRCLGASPELLAKVLDCVKDTRFLPFRCLDLLHKQGLVD